MVDSCIYPKRMYMYIKNHLADPFNGKGKSPAEINMTYLGVNPELVD